LKVLVDTSAWVDFLNGYPSPERSAIADLLVSDHEVCTCGVVIAEVFQGLRREKGRAEIGEMFREMVYLDPAGVDLYFRAAEIYRQLRERGLTVRSTIDCLIAVLAEENGCSILARDRDLRVILESGLVDARPWPVGGPSA
jgi:predicted nucleic acid-binding protein